MTSSLEGPTSPTEMPRRPDGEREHVPQPDEEWTNIPHLFRSSPNLLPYPWEELFGPLRHGTVDHIVVVGQFGQSVDARIATASGHAHYINGPSGLAHLHCLRALVDVVVVGVGTAVADDPQLTVRRVAGPSPARVVIDPRGRMPASARAFADDGVRRLVISANETELSLPHGVERILIPAPAGNIAPASIVAALAERGFRRILIEGGANTVSRFLAARCLDRLHIVIAPIIIGAGPSSIALAPIAKLDDALRLSMRAHVLGDEILLDCDLAAHRAPIGFANTST